LQEYPTPNAADYVFKQMHPAQSCDEVAEILIHFLFDVDSDHEELLHVSQSGYNCAIDCFYYGGVHC